MKKLILFLAVLFFSVTTNAQHDPFKQYVNEQMDKKDSSVYILRRGLKRYVIPDSSFRPYKSTPPRQIRYITRWEYLIPKNEKRGKLTHPW